MKRKQFLVTSDNTENVIKYSWNSAIRETERLIREIAIKSDNFYELVDSHIFAKEGVNHIHGSKTWINRSTGETVTFTIKKL